MHVCETERLILTIQRTSEVLKKLISLPFELSILSVISILTAHRHQSRQVFKLFSKCKIAFLSQPTLHMAVKHLSLCGNYQQRTCKSMYSSTRKLVSCYLLRRTLLHPWYDATVQTSQSQHISSQGHFLDIKINIQKQYISFSVSGQTAGIYIKDRQAEGKIFGIFISSTRREARSVFLQFNSRHFWFKGHYLVVWSG